MRILTSVALLCAAVVFGLTLGHVLQAPGSRSLDAAAWLAVSPRTLETLVADGDLTPIDVRGQRRFSREQLLAYAHRCTRTRRRR